MEGCKRCLPAPSFALKNCSIKEIYGGLSSQLTSYLFEADVPGNIRYDLLMGNCRRKQAYGQPPPKHVSLIN